MKKIALSGILILSANLANAVTVTEVGDFNGSASFSQWGESNIGLLDSGINTISGSLAGTCVPGDCNSAGDSQDSFLIEIASGFKIDSIIATTANIIAPADFSSSLSVYQDAFSNNVLRTYMPFNTSSAALLLSESGTGLYSFSVYGQNASEAGDFSFDYSLQIGVSAVPVPAAVWLFGSGLIGLVSVARRKKTA